MPNLLSNNNVSNIKVKQMIRRIKFRNNGNIKLLSEKYGVTRETVRLALMGVSDSPTAKEIRKYSIEKLGGTWI